MFEKLVKILSAKSVKSQKEIADAIRHATNDSKSLPPFSHLLRIYQKMVKRGEIERNKNLESLLKKRKTRTISGVAVITVLTKPYPCPGKCVYCPTEAKMPKSYLSNEPAAARALKLKFNPYEQTKQRIQTLADIGHPTDKIELIVKGGTWSVYPKKYREWFIKRCFDAANLKPSKNLSEAQKINEKSKRRIIGLTLETRPDFINPEEIKHLRKLGCTRLELGVQTIYDNILQQIERGHKAKDSALATEMLRNSGFKVDYHLMPMLPGATPKKDLEMMAEIFKNPAYRPDMIKIYPCSVVKGSKLYKIWKEGEYKPYSDKNLIEILIKIKSEIIPYYCRISRLIRDIPGTSISAGNKITNLREIIQKEMRGRNLKCKCIRCREAGRATKIHKKLKLFIDKYETLGGTEYFLGLEDPKREAIFAFLRLRLPKNENNIIPEIKNSALIREVHTYGSMVPIGKIEKDKVQHSGLGKKLMIEAEKIARKNGYKKIAVISGIGAREYYKKIGYILEGTYMTKNIC
jgi:elongator complex protein 3